MDQQRFPTWKQVIVMLAGGFVLAITACVGFLASFSGNFERGGDTLLTPIAAILFFVGVLAFLGGFVLLIVRGIRALTQKNEPPASPPAP